MNAGHRDSWCSLFKKLNILPLYSKYIFSLSTFEVKNRDAFKSNSAKHTIVSDKALNYILQQQIWQKNKNEHIILQLKLSKIYH